MKTMSIFIVFKLTTVRFSVSGLRVVLVYRLYLRTHCYAFYYCTLLYRDVGVGVHARVELAIAVCE